MSSAEPSTLHGGAARGLGWLCPALLLASCGALSWEHRGVDDDGRICLVAGEFFATSNDVRIEADQPLTLHVVGELCLSSSCSRDTQASCSVVLHEHELFVTSRFRWEEQTRGSCTDDCNALAATCTTSEPLPAGTYVVRHGAAQHSLTIPSQQTPSCLGSALRAPP